METVPAPRFGWVGAGEKRWLRERRGDNPFAKASQALPSPGCSNATQRSQPAAPLPPDPSCCEGTQPIQGRLAHRHLSPSPSGPGCQLRPVPSENEPSRFPPPHPTKWPPVEEKPSSSSSTPPREGPGRAEHLLPELPPPGTAAEGVCVGGETRDLAEKGQGTGIGVFGSGPGPARPRFTGGSASAGAGSSGFRGGRGW